jgi:hypothetical protein
VPGYSIPQLGDIHGNYAKFIECLMFTVVAGEEPDSRNDVQKWIVVFATVKAHN